MRNTFLSLLCIFLSLFSCIAKEKLPRVSFEKPYVQTVSADNGNGENVSLCAKKCVASDYFSEQNSLFPPQTFFELHKYDCIIRVRFLDDCAKICANKYLVCVSRRQTLS